METQFKCPNCAGTGYVTDLHKYTCEQCLFCKGKGIIVLQPPGEPSSLPAATMCRCELPEETALKSYIAHKSDGGLVQVQYICPGCEKVIVVENATAGQGVLCDNCKLLSRAY